jgi:hypothetical protein
MDDEPWYVKRDVDRIDSPALVVYKTGYRKILSWQRG